MVKPLLSGVSEVTLDTLPQLLEDIQKLLISVDAISNDKGALSKVQERIISTLLPPEALFSKTRDFDPSPHKEITKSQLKIWREISTTGFQILSKISNRNVDRDPQRQLALSSDLLTLLFAYSFSSDPWTSTSSSKASEELLSQIKSTFLLPTPNGTNSPSTYTTLLTSILKDTIRPLFSKSKTPTITPAGRKSAYSDPQLPPSFSNEASNKPWKYTEPYIVNVFGAILSEFQSQDIESNWPLLIPPLLAILDDSATPLKVRGCEYLQIFLGKVPPGLLQRTGLGEVFWETLMPCLSYLPTLTPEYESLELLGAVYPTLLELVSVRFPGDGKGKVLRDGGEKDEKRNRESVKALDEVLRKGVLHGYAHVGTDHVKIGTFLVEKLAYVVDAMGIQAIRHLKGVIPLLTSILTSPFSTTYPPLLISAISSLSTLILNCWPRVPFYRGEILKGICVLWLRIQEEEDSNEGLGAVKDQIRKLLSLVKATVESAGIDWMEESAVLVAAKPELKSLFMT